METFAVKLAVAQYLGKQRGPQGFASVDRHYRCSPVQVPQKVMAAFDACDFKSGFLQRGNEVPCRECSAKPSCVDSHPLHPDEVEVFSRLAANFKTKFDSFPHPDHEFVEGFDLGMAAGQNGHRCHEIALGIAFNNDIKLSGHRHLANREFTLAQAVK